MKGTRKTKLAIAAAALILMLSACTDPDSEERAVTSDGMKITVVDITYNGETHQYLMTRSHNNFKHF